MPATSVPSPGSTTGPVTGRSAAVEDLLAARAAHSDPITVIRRTPRPPMRGDDRLDRRVSRRITTLRQRGAAR